MKRLLLFLLGLFAGGFVVDLMLGEHYSPVPSNAATALSYLELYGRWSSVDGDRGGMILVAKPFVYRWRPGAAATKVLMPTAELMRESQDRDWNENLKDLVEVAVAAPAGSLLQVLLTESRATKSLGKWQLAVMAVTTVGGGVIGYSVKHRSSPDTGDPRFIKNMEDPSIWSAADSDFRRLVMGFVGPCKKGGFKDERDDENVRVIPRQLRAKIFSLHPELIDAIIAGCKAEDPISYGPKWAATLRGRLVKPSYP